MTHNIRVFFSSQAFQNFSFVQYDHQTSCVPSFQATETPLKSDPLTKKNEAGERVHWHTGSLPSGNRRCSAKQESRELVETGKAARDATKKLPRQPWSNLSPPRQFFKTMASHYTSGNEPKCDSTRKHSHPEKAVYRLLLHTAVLQDVHQLNSHLAHHVSPTLQTMALICVASLDFHLSRSQSAANSRASLRSTSQEKGPVAPVARHFHSKNTGASTICSKNPP